MFRVVRTVLILIYGVSFIRCGKSDGIKIQISQNSSEIFCTNTGENNFQEDQYIYIEYDVSHELDNIKANSCYEKNNAANKLPTPKLKNYGKKLAVTVDMGTIWTCEFLTNNEHRITCDFPVHVRFNVAASISINNKPIKLSTPDYSATEYIVEAQYECDDYELIYITCDLISGNGMRFSVNGPANESLIPAKYYKEAQSIHLRAILNKKYNLSNINCVVQKTPYRDIIHRILVVPKKEASVNDDLIIRVNGLKLDGQSEGKAAVYEYQEGELVNITCAKIGNAMGDIELLFGDDTEREVLQVGANIFTTLNTSQINENKELLVTCQIGTKIQKRLTLTEASEKDVIIRGLVQRNIIVSYNNEHNGNTTVYAYEGHEVLNLTWISGPSVAVYSEAYVLQTWKDKILSHSGQVSLASSKVISSRTIHLSPEDEGSTIQCIIIYSQEHVVLSSITFRRIVTDNSINGNNKPNIAIVVPVSSAVFIFVMLAVLCVIYKYCQTRNRFPEEASELNAGNVSSNNPTQFPETWDDYANAVMNSTQTSSSYVDLKYLYASPILKKDRQFNDQVVVARENSLYEPMENDDKNLKKKFDERKGIPKCQNRKKYENLADDSCDHESPNDEKELYSEVSLKG